MQTHTKLWFPTLSLPVNTSGPEFHIGISCVYTAAGRTVLLIAPHRLHLIPNYMLVLITLTPTANFRHIKTHSITDAMITTRDFFVSAGPSQEKPWNT